MSNTSVYELQKELEKMRGKLYAVVEGDINKLLDKEAYFISTELDGLIVKLMKKEDFSD